MKGKHAQLALGYIMSNAFAVAIEAIITFMYRFKASINHNMGSILGISTFLLVPIAMGMICAWYWRGVKLRTITKLGMTLMNMLFSFALAVIFIHEGAGCLLIVSPLIYIMMFTGLLIGNAIIKRRSNTLNFSVSGLLAILFVADMITPHHFEKAVSDEMIINATPDKIWPYVVSYPEIKAPSHFWFFTIGLPKPIGTTVTGYCKGAGRKCIFEKNLVFDEIMSTFEPGKNLTFDVTKEPQDPEIMGHINIERGQFLLKDNHNGTTTLLGTSWYSLNVYPALYFDLWASTITRNVHIRVMEHIKSLSEKN